MIGGVVRRGISAARALSRVALRGYSWLRSFFGGTTAAPASRAPVVRFLAVGRQGYGNLRSHRIAAAMERAACEAPTHGVLYLGDNFYPRGVSSVADSQWRHKFERLYCGTHLRGMPFFSVVGNHDAQGNTTAQVQYGRQRHGSGRWNMDDRFYVRNFGIMGGRALARVAFLDTVLLHKDPSEQLEFLRATFGPDCDSVWRVVVGHYGCRSLTQEPYTRRLTLSGLIPELQELRVDLYLSANDRFQQLLDRGGEPMHVSANGGGDKAETGLTAEDPETDFVSSQGGFAVLELTAHALSVELRDASGQVSYRRQRRR